MLSLIIVLIISFSNNSFNSYQYPYNHDQLEFYNTENQILLPTTGDSFNTKIEYAGSWPFGICQATEYDTLRDLCFLASGGGVYILDVSDPYNPVEISDNIHAEDRIYRLFYEQDNQRLFLIIPTRGNNFTLYYGFEIWDVSSPETPIKLTHCKENCFNLTAKDNYVYLCCSDSLFQGFKILNISDLSNIYEVYQNDSIGWVFDIIVSDSFIVTIGDKFYIFDKTDISNLNITSYLDENGYNLGINGNIVYISGPSFKVIDISNLFYPELIGSCNGGSNCSFDIYGNYAYLINYSLPDYLKIIDISVDSNPHVIGECSLPIVYNPQISAYGNYVYIPFNQSGFSIIDATDPSNPFMLPFNKPSIISTDLFINDNYCFLLNNCCEPDCGFIKIINISDITNPYEISCCSLPSKHHAYRIDVKDNYAYIVSEIFWDSLYFLNIIDISDINNPTLVQTYEIDIWNMFIYENQLYVSCTSCVNIFDLTDPVNPQLISNIPTTNLCGIYVKDDYGYFSGSDGLDIVDLHDPYNPLIISNCSNVIGSGDIYIEGNYAYITNIDGHLFIVDISDKYNPVLTSQIKLWDLSVCAFCSIEVYGDYAYISNEYCCSYRTDLLSQIHIINISDPYNPKIIAKRSTQGNITEIKVDENNIFVSSAWTGLYIYKFDNTTGIIEEPVVVRNSNITTNRTFFSRSSNNSLTWSNLPPSGKIEIFSVDGRKILEREFTDQQGNITYSFDKNISAGIYFYLVTDRQGNILKKDKLGIIE